jgi:hypothetical protein
MAEIFAITAAAVDLKADICGQPKCKYELDRKLMGH